MQKTLQILFLLLTLVFTVTAQEIKTIKLRQQKAVFQPKHYHVISVIDSRADTTNIGTMRKRVVNKVAPINLVNGAKYAISQYINNNINQDKSTLPIVVHIKELEIKEETIDGKQQVNLHMGLAYYIGKSQLIEYTGTAYIQTGFDASAYIDKIIRSNLVSNLKEFDRWAGQNKSNIKTSPTVNVKVKFAKTSSNKDYILYEQRNLRLDDFTGEADELSMGVAATFSGINASYSIQKLGMTTTITATITAYFHKKKSWVKDEGYNTRVLSHEQLHFAITALKACILAERIKNYTFSPDNYSEELSSLIADIDIEASKLQKQYDLETNHGTLQNEQDKWKKDITTQLAAQNYF